MTDREMLELAAKAAGLKLQWESDGTLQNRMNRPTIPYESHGMNTAIDWNPLTDDGDALRLAVKLCITPGNYGCGCEAVSIDGVTHCDEFNADDPCAATRRAIVRAAAEIGKEMK